VWLLPTLSVQAGLYNTQEPLLGVVLDPSAKYAAFLNDLRQIVADPMTNVKDSPRRQVLDRVAALEAKLKDGEISMQDRINLSAFYVRLNEPEKAKALLESVPTRQREWMLLSNLATAYQLMGNLDRAEAYLMEALEKWPEATSVTNAWQLNWLKVVEQHQLRLIRGRAREQQKGGGPATTIDGIFPGLRLVGPSGEYEAGLLANDQWAKLPANYAEILKLLVLWLPHDARLRWLFAEIENAKGNFAIASNIMEDLSETRGFRNPEFVAHQLVLRHAKTTAERQYKLHQMFVEERIAVPVLSGILPPAPSAMLDAVATAEAMHVIMQAPLPREEPNFATDVAPSPASNTSPPSGTWTPEWRQISVSFVAGVIVALLLSMQLREMRKRKQDAEPAAKE
jgi:hypothetical protein